MCEICRQSPHHPHCPYAPEPEIIAECEECGAEIRDGDWHYKIGDHIFCEECVYNGYKQAEADDWYGRR